MSKLVSYTRNPVYVFYALAAIVLYLACWLFVSRSQVGFLEKNVFNLVYGLPVYLDGVFTLVLGVGVLSLTIGVLLISLIRRRYDALTRAIFAMLFSLIASLLLGLWAQRDQPSAVLPDVSQRLSAAGNGFPSALMAIATAGALTIALYIPGRYRRWLNYTLMAIGTALIFLAVSLPLDVIGGYAVGLLGFSLGSLAFGSVYHPVSVKKLEKRLKAGGLKGVRLKSASVDARGSVPFFGEYDGGPIFVKVFNQDNNAADWLFKVVRRLRYRRLEDEVPSLTPKRTIEHEAYITILAKHSAGARVPEIVGVFKVEHNSYAMATKRIDATGLDKLSGNKITNTMLEQVWEQINKLHNARIIHKDLRAANVMIENSTQLPWIIDFGFSESSVDRKSYYKDTVEFIASSATKVGAKRAIAAAHASIGSDDISRALPYMQYAALSGATTTALKQHKTLLGEILLEMSRVADSPSKEFKKAKLKRLGLARRNK